MTPLAGRRVARMNGAGNKILVLDLRDGTVVPTPAEARAIHRAPGLDYDQMMVLTPARTPDTLSYVPIYNNDGSLAGACGNGTRCVADRLARETGAARLTVETARGLIVCERLAAWTYRVDMGPPLLGWRDIPLAREADTVALDIPQAAAFGPAGLVNMGNPHAVFFVADLDAIDLVRAGPPLERHPLFPERANISFARILARESIRLKVWERGVGATLACGSAACATLVAASRRGLAGREAAIELPGGELTIAWRRQDGHVLMTGPVEFEREIELAPAIFA
ncbi:MAG TPA: diaminopimelate epimerase [Roseiarcus sp.]|nr:diaminopimelate epimerase [Roseiarcus sp.]